MEEHINKKEKKKLIIGLLLFIFLLLGASYAYFQVGTINNFGESTIDGNLSSLSSIALRTNNKSLTLNLSNLDMMDKGEDVTYYATNSGAVTERTKEVIGYTSTVGNDYNNCTYTLTLTPSSNDNLYTAFQGMATKSAGQIVLKIDGVTYDFNTANLFPLTHTGSLLGVKQGEEKQIEAEFYLVNKTNYDQNALAGKSISMNITVSNFSCTTITPASSKLIALAEDTNNASKITRYTGPVTDECSANSCTTIQQAQNVYIFTSNDINNVIFEGFCWKVIRTTETGGIKLLYNGLPTTVSNHEVCNNTGVNTMLTATQIGKEEVDANSFKITYSQNGGNNKPAYAGYMYNPNSSNSNYYNQIRADNVNQADSLFKEKIEYWFSNSNIDESKLEDTVYCNDRSLDSTSPVTEENLVNATSGQLYFADYDGTKQTLECEYLTDSFNTSNTKAQTNYKVGFMTAAEARLITSTVFTNSSQYWLASPRIFDTVTRVRRPGASVAGNGVSTGEVAGVRPVISASAGVQITGGEGSTISPFIME